MKTVSLFSISSFVAALFLCCTTPEPKQEIVTNKLIPTTMDTNNVDTATFGAGCFWCVEAVFKILKEFKKLYLVIAEDL
jgi:peptide-methionine (S)-S-oxide reductase